MAFSGAIIVYWILKSTFMFIVNIIIAIGTYRLLRRILDAIWPNKTTKYKVDITSEAPSQLFRRRNALSPWVEFNKALFDDPVFRQTGDYKNSPLNQVYYDSMAMVQRGYENNYKNLKTSFDGYITNSGGITFTALDSMYTSSLIGKNYKQDMINIKYWAASKANNDKARIQVTGAVKDNNTILEKITIYWPNTNKEILLHSEDINNIPPFEKSNDQDESPPIIEGLSWRNLNMMKSPII
ncbi:23935_t:CDS:2 [Entrophospora sp. SA101]|nr:23935_t:CDS:2 [Entrophospora sp. SA101]CAJ0846380.1 14235_t:CDS:2 [Entrophospora sp. SA101]CAJ0884774.1 596_t:CDS:2 [Entrophospora sp. SA101]